MRPNFRLTYPDPSEDEIHESVARILDIGLPGNACWYSVEHRNAQSAVEGAKRKRRGVRAGVPDIMIVHGGVAHFIELKARAGKLSPAQEKMRDKLRGAGASWAECRSPDDVIGVVRGWGIPLRISI